jgi:hypothetical protein
MNILESPISYCTRVRKLTFFCVRKTHVLPITITLRFITFVPVGSV